MAARQHPAKRKKKQKKRHPKEREAKRWNACTIQIRIRLEQQVHDVTPGPRTFPASLTHLRPPPPPCTHGRTWPHTASTPTRAWSLPREASSTSCARRTRASSSRGTAGGSTTSWPGLPSKRREAKRQREVVGSSSCGELNERGREAGFHRLVNERYKNINERISPAPGIILMHGLTRQSFAEGGDAEFLGHF